MMRSMLLALAMTIAACSSGSTTTSSSGGQAEEDGDGASTTSTTTTQSVQKLSESFQSRCSVCHGSEGRGGGGYPELPGVSTASAFISTVRSGKGRMASFDESQISDSDLKSDFKWMTTQRD